MSDSTLKFSNTAPAARIMAQRVAQFDWSKTSLGAIDHWPAVLRTAVDVCLNTRFPMRIWWGPEFINIYNDAYSSLLGERHPDALGQSAPKLWPEIWQKVAPQIEAVMLRGESTWSERIHVVTTRNGAPEDAWFTFSYSPIRESSGKIGGVLGIATEDTAEVLAERERGRLIEQKRRTDEQARTILESITDAFFGIDADWRFTYLNPQAEKILGYLPGELIGKNLWEQFPGLHGSEFAPLYLGAMSQKVSGSITSYYPDHDRWYEVHSYPAPDGISVYFRDVTGRKRDEIAVKQIAEKYDRQSRLFERLASATPDFFYVFDLDGRVIYANRRLLEVWGTSYDEAVGKTLYELNYPQWHADMHMCEIRQVIETKRPIKGEVPFTGPTGISGFYEYIFTPILSPDGQVEVIAGTTRDVTERRELEERMARDGMLLANVRDAVVVTDLEGIITFWNDGATRLFGWTAKEMLGQPYVARLPESSRSDVAARITTIANGESEFDGEWLDFTRQGNRIWVEATARQIKDRLGKPLGMMAVGRGITDRKKADAEREALLASEQAARAEAERTSRLKDEFLATLSHEIRTPLNAILGWSQVMKTSKDADDLTQGLEVIERNARAQSQIVEDLLDMSRIIGGKVRLDIHRLNLAPIIQAAVETARPTAEAKGVRLQALIDPLQSIFINGDANRLQQVLWNLLSNSIKFTPKDGRVNVLVDCPNSHVEISVRDTGEGIRPEFLPFVFDRFRQADASTTRRHGGLGLGLSIVKQLVELHGGSVRVKSPGIGQGSTFTVAIPLTLTSGGIEPDAARPQATLEKESSRANDLCPDIAGLRVIVIDDEPDARILVKRLLEDCGAVVAIAATGNEAVALVESGNFDVLVSDIGMPNEDGYMLIKRIRSLPKGGTIPAIALTAYARSEDRVKAITAGFQMHVAKPVEPIELITMLAGAVGRTGKSTT